ncbi:MAG: aquaporin [Bacteriovoracaceae bacterium]|nr:aquaporin [Bacteriovoracaceae bacterium]
MKVTHQASQYVAEFIGTFFLVFFGCGAMILSQLIPQELNPLAVPICFGGAVSIMIYATGHISGAHFNPAVTIAFWITKRFPTVRVPGYLAAQFLGALTASFFHKFIWATPQNTFGATVLSTSLPVGFGVEFVLSFALMFVIISVATDSRAVGELAGIAIGSTVAMCAFVGGPLTNASMNPARSLGPAVLSGNPESLWLYFLAPILGCASGALVYEWMRCNKESSDDSHGCC